MDNLDIILTQFKGDSTQTELVFSNKTSEERKRIHELCVTHNLHSESKGLCAERKLYVTKKQVKPKNEVTITDTDRKMLIKDYMLPIPIHLEPYFSYYINFLDPIADTKAKYNLLLDAKAILNKQQNNLKDESHRIMNTIISAIRNAPDYTNLIKDSKYDAKILPSEFNIYNKTSFYCISIDIIKANFTSAKFISSELVLNCDTWEELIGRFTDIDYFIQSKHFRQIIYGNLGIKKLPVVQKYMLGELHNKLKDKVKVLGKCNTDELFVSTTKETIKDDYQTIINLISELPDNLKHIWKIIPVLIEPLGQLAHTRKIFNDLDNLDNYKLEIKNVNKDLYAQAYKFYKGEKITDDDLMAMKEEYPIKYCAPAFFI